MHAIYEDIPKRKTKLQNDPTMLTYRTTCTCTDLMVLTCRTTCICTDQTNDLYLFRSDALTYRHSCTENGPRHVQGVHHLVGTDVKNLDVPVIRSS